MLRPPSPKVDFLPACWTFRHTWKGGVCTEHKSTFLGFQATPPVALTYGNDPFLRCPKVSSKGWSAGLGASMPQRPAPRRGDAGLMQPGWWCRPGPSPDCPYTRLPPRRLAPMRLYTLSKRHFVLVFVVFFICFGLTVIVGIKGKSAF